MSPRKKQQNQSWRAFDMESRRLIMKAHLQVRALRHRALACNDLPTAALLSVAEEHLNACRDGITRYNNPEQI